jgi:hypothetical protein
MNFDNYPIDDKTDLAVLDMIAAIIHEANFLKPSVEVDVDLVLCLDSKEEYASNQASIVSNLGIVVVFPDFTNKTAKACIVNKGMINNMKSEGFDEEFIQNNGKIYSNLFDFTKDNIHTLGYYLTHKL